jgi:Dynamin family
MPHPSLVPGLDALAQWRHDMLRQWQDLVRMLIEHDLLTAVSAETAEGVRVRLLRDKLVLALVAEFSRGKSELINAIFFSEAGRRVLPATPGRTTMCPVELAWNEGEEPSLDLLPIESRAEVTPLADLRQQRDKWVRIALDGRNLSSMADALVAVTRTKRVRPKEAESFGLWSMQANEDLRRIGEDGLVDVPAWRHAIINFPHPLLKRGLVVLDTPGLNAIGSEPELTLSLLPSAHAALFVLGADTGVTRSDLTVWQEHLGDHAANCFVALNKVDMLDDPLIPAAEVERQVEAQCRSTAQTLGISRDRVFPISARGALAARLHGDAAGLRRSRLPELESALGAELLQKRQQVLADAVTTGSRHLASQAVLRVRELRRHNAEQMLELRGLRGKSGGKIRHMLQRVEQETAEFEQCGHRIAALRSVHGRMTAQTTKPLGNGPLRDDMARLKQAVGESWLRLGARKALAKLCAQLRERFDESEREAREMAAMLEASFRQLNTEFGFSLMVSPQPTLADAREELDRVERGFARYTGLTHAIRMQSSTFSSRFNRMLESRLQIVVESASGEVESWSQSALSQLDSQLRERRRNFRRRRDALERIQTATDELESRLAEVEGADQTLHRLLTEATERADVLCNMALRGPKLPGGAAAAPAAAASAAEARKEVALQRGPGAA